MANTGQAGSNDERALLGEAAASVAPATANAQLQYNLGQEQLGLINTNFTNQQAYNNAMSGYQGQNLQLAEQGLGIQQTALGQQGAQQAAQQGIERQQFGIQQGQYPEQQAEAALAYQNAMRNTQGAQAISGTQNTVGGKADVSTLTQQYGFQQQDIARQQALSQLGQKGEESAYGYSQEQLANAQQNLALNAKANGISEQQLMTMLNNANQQAGVGAQQNIIQLLSGQATNAAGQVMNTGSALSALGSSIGINATAGTNIGVS